MALTIFVAISSLWFFTFTSLDQLLAYLDKLAGFFLSLSVDLLGRFLDVIQKSHALAQLILHSVSLLLVRLRLVLQLFKSIFKFFLLIALPAFTLLSTFALTGKFLYQLTNLRLIFWAKISEAHLFSIVVVWNACSANGIIGQW